MTQAYKRGWQHGKERGRESRVTCGFCGSLVPKYKTFSVVRSFKITDPLLRDALEIRDRSLSLSSNKMYACPACARHRHIVRRRKH